MTFFLDVLPTRTGGAAENMAVDFLLLKRYPAGGRGGGGHARFRHYGWHRPAFTFGYSQKIDYARAQLPADGSDGGDGGVRMELCRRPTGGGVVDHRDDWTYALVIPREHALCEAPASESYRVVHACIADALGALGERVILKKEADGADGETGGAGGSNATPTVCFERAERFDVVRADTGKKIAGAAQKRAKEGLLFQGSLARTAVSRELDWDAFEAEFTGRLAKALGAEAVECPWPELAEHEVEGLVEQYSGDEWNAFR